MPITLFDILTFQAKKAHSLTLDGTLVVPEVSPEKFKDMLTKAISESKHLQQLVLMNDISPDIAQTAINAINSSETDMTLVLRGKNFSLSTALKIVHLLKTKQSINQIYMKELSEKILCFFSFFFSDINFPYDYRWIKTIIGNSMSEILYITRSEEKITYYHYQELMQAKEVNDAQKAIIPMQEQTVETRLVNQQYLLQRTLEFISPTGENFSESNDMSRSTALPQQNQSVKRCKSNHTNNEISCHPSEETKQVMNTQNHLSTNFTLPLVTVNAESYHRQLGFSVNMPIPNILSALLDFQADKEATTLLLSNDDSLNDFTFTLTQSELLRDLLRDIVSYDRLQHLILHNEIDKGIVNIAIAYYRGKLLTLSGHALGSETARTIIHAALDNRYIYQLHLQNIPEPILAYIYGIFTANLIAKKCNIREIACNNNTTYAAKFAQFVQNILKQEITALINDASAVMKYEGKKLFSPLLPASACLTANKLNTNTSNSQVLVKK